MYRHVYIYPVVGLQASRFSFAPNATSNAGGSPKCRGSLQRARISVWLLGGGGGGWFFSASETEERMSRLLLIFITSISKNKYRTKVSVTASDKLWVGHWSECSSRLYFVYTLKLFYRSNARQLTTNEKF